MGVVVVIGLTRVAALQANLNNSPGDVKNATMPAVVGKPKIRSARRERPQGRSGFERDRLVPLRRPDSLMFSVTYDASKRT